MNDKILGVLWLDKYPLMGEGSKRGAFISLVDVIFMQSDPNVNTVYGEESINGHRPVNIKAISSEHAVAGDHIIKIQFVYSDGENWYSSQDDVIIHIKEWYELLWVQIMIPFSLIFLGILINLSLHKFGKKKNGN